MKKNSYNLIIVGGKLSYSRSNIWNFENIFFHGIFSALQELNVYFYNLNEIQRQKRLHRIFFQDHQSITATKNWENWNLLIYLTECRVTRDWKSISIKKL